MNLYIFLQYFLYFMFYSFIGWCMEVLLVLIQDKKFVNRGFLIGPYCPIYGYGVLLIILLLKDFMFNPIALFLLSMILCMILEYLTSYVMEKIFKARWWDYSDKKFNLNGRICLETSIPFGLGGTLIMYVINPFVVKVVGKLPLNLLLIISTLLKVIYIIDNIVSFSTIIKIDKINFREYMDNTEEITRMVKEHLKKIQYLQKDLLVDFLICLLKINKIKL